MPNFFSVKDMERYLKTYNVLRLIRTELIQCTLLCYNLDVGHQYCF